MGAPTRLRRYIIQPLVRSGTQLPSQSCAGRPVSSLRPNPMQPPRRTKRPAEDGDDDVKATAEARRFYGRTAYDFLDDDDPGGVSLHGSGDMGFLDESGSFVERTARGGTKEEAWLGAADVDGESPGPAATKRARKALERQEVDERILEGVVGSRAIFDIKKRIAGLLQPGETVPRALRRLKGDKRGGGKGMDEAARCAFDELMDASAELVRRGDLDAYTDDREAFERGAWDYEHARRRRLLAREAREDDEADQQPAAAARVYSVDMFGDDAVDVRAGDKTAVDPSGGHAAKPDQPAAQLDASSVAAAVEAGGVVAGCDYVYEPASGYYYSGSTGHYYDAASGCYWSASTGTWFSYDVDVEASKSECRGALLQMFG
ncbi:hypothetical protein ACQJBY_039667 [Aegilops geniculata]